MRAQRLDSVCLITMGQAPPGDSYNTDGHGYPLIAGAGDFSEGGIVSKKFTTAPGKISDEGDVILGIRASIGDKVLSNGRYCLGRGVAGLRPLKGLDRRYLWQWLDFSKGELAAKGRGATFLQVNRNDIGEMEIPLPSLGAQKRIAAVLDQVDTLRAQRREAIALLGDLTQSIFRNIFGEPANYESSLVRLDDVLERRLRNGVSPSSQGTVASQVLTLSAITRGRFDGNARKSAKFMSDPTVDHSVSRDLFMICRGNGNKNLVGRGVFPRVNMHDTAYPDTVLAAPIRSDVVDPVYLENVWATPGVRRQIENASRTTNGTYKVNQKTMGAVMFVLPSIGRQREFARQVQAVEDVKRAHVAHLATLDELFTSLQHRAFSGTLWDHETPGEAA